MILVRQYFRPKHLCYRSISKCFVLAGSKAMQQKLILKKMFRTRIFESLKQQQLECKSNKNNNESWDVNDSAMLQEHRKNYDELLTKLNNYPESPSVSSKIMCNIDEIWYKTVERLSTEEILNLLHLLVKTGYTRVQELKLFRNSLLALTKEAQKGKLTNSELVQLLFFEGLGKEKSKKRMKHLLQFLPSLNDLTLIEKVAVCTATYKCDIKLKSEDTELLERLIETNAHELVKDQPVLGALCKALNRSGTSKDFLLTNLSKEILSNRVQFETTSSAYILQLFVIARYYDYNVIKKLYHNSAQKSRGWTKRPMRIKDFNMIFWALSWFNFTLEDYHKKVAMKFVTERFEEFQKKPYLLVNTLLSLWILDCRLISITDKCLRTGIFTGVKIHETEWRTAGKLQLFLRCLKIECPEVQVPKNLLNIPKTGMKVSSSTRKFFNMFTRSKKISHIRKIEIEYPDCGVYIPGVTFWSKGKKIHVDILDNTTCFKNTVTPHGFTNLKLRLIKQMGYHSIMLPENVLCDDETLFARLSEMIEEIHAKEKATVKEDE